MQCQILAFGGGGGHHILDMMEMLAVIFIS